VAVTSGVSSIAERAAHGCCELCLRWKLTMLLSGREPSAGGRTRLVDEAVIVLCRAVELFKSINQSEASRSSCEGEGEC
jgi:hypothetical protein